MSSQFKFKPDKIKYLSTIDTLDSSHKKIINDINKKRIDMPKKEKKLQKLKNDLEILDSKNSEINDYINIRTKLIDEINNLAEEIDKIENYEDELEYYEKTHEILFNYYDIIDGHKIVSTNNINNNSINNINLPDNSDRNINTTTNNTILNNNSENITDNKYELFSDIKSDNKYDLFSDIKIESDNENFDKLNIQNKIINNIGDEYKENKKFTELNENKKNQWEIDGIEIFKKSNSLDKLDILNQMSKSKRKEKKTTRKRVKNVESLVRDSNNIFDYLDGKHISSNNNTNSVNNINDAKNNTNVDIVDNKADNKNDNRARGINNNSNNPDNIVKLNINNVTINNNIIVNNDKNMKKYDRASLFEDYKILLDGYSTQKKSNKPCINCGPPINKVLMYSEGFYVCVICGEIDKCIIENEITNYKDPMIEKPTFPYKRKNHFCEWIKFIFSFVNNISIMS